MMLTGMEAVNNRAKAESGIKPYTMTVQNLVIFKFSVVYHLPLTTTKIIPYHLQIKTQLSSHFFPNGKLRCLYNSRKYYSLL